MKNEEKDSVELVLPRNLQRRNGGRRHSIFLSDICNRISNCSGVVVISE